MSRKLKSAQVTRPATVHSHMAACGASPMPQKGGTAGLECRPLARQMNPPLLAQTL
jgi:hypothetical protein